MSDAQHTPGQIAVADVFIYSKETREPMFATKGLSKADAERLANCWNCHDDLLEALAEVRNQLVTLRADCHAKGMRLSNERTNMTSAAVLIADRAIAKAKGQA